MVTLITGAPGWLGTRLAYRLSRDEKIRCLVQVGVDSSSVKGFTSDIVFGDLRKPDTLKATLQDVDTVFHLAAVLHSSRVRDYYEVNASGTENLLNLALKSGVRRFIHVSSDAAIGANISRDRPMTEEDEPRPIAVYGKSKLLGERHVMRAHEEHGLKTTIVRPFWTYGPGQPQRALQLMRMIQKGRVPLIGDGEMLRSMTYVDHTIDALILARASKKAVGSSYFIADERPYAVKEIFGAIAAALGVQFRPLLIPTPVSWGCQIADKALCRLLGRQVTQFFVLNELRHDITGSIEKAKRDLGYKPTVTLEEGMKEAVAWARAQGQL